MQCLSCIADGRRHILGEQTHRSVGLLYKFAAAQIGNVT